MSLFNHGKILKVIVTLTGKDGSSKRIEAEKGEELCLISVSSQPVFHNQASEMFKSSIIGAFRFLVEATGRKFTHFQVKTYTVTTCPLTAAWFISAVTQLQILFFFTFHIHNLQSLLLFYTRVEFIVVEL